MASDEMNGDNTKKKDEKNSSGSSSPKSCADCRTTKTPLWRGGPSGPKSLCNACGIRYRKNRAASVIGSSPTTTSPDRKRQRPPQHPQVAAGSSDTSKGGLSESVKMSLVQLGKDFLLQTSAVTKKQRCQRKRKRDLGEEELAAVSLMALSCGSVFA
ncbi:hypothetical protein SAY87_003389 [Trapa incisa]|uniref:GATA-type domain-containing protein n=1 Tax=Trapa incisa TaxID=236973 RepID=A0AAN7KP45_9MYRT|nr:hypothetical protein SAY87_003389 [Trapa incisa]